MSPAHRSEGMEGEPRIESRSRGGASSVDNEGEVRRGEDCSRASNPLVWSNTTALEDGDVGASSLQTLIIAGDGTVTDTAVCIGIVAARTRLHM